MGSARMHIADLRVLGRATQGVKLINLRGKDTIASITKVDADPEEEAETVDGEVIVEQENTADADAENQVGETSESEQTAGEEQTDNQ